ncbi:MAG: HAD-IIIA family hydrolase [Patescibacteria group bacterium]
MNKAVFFDRDGVINEMAFDAENGLVHIPWQANQIVLNHGIVELLKTTKKSGFLNVIVSNQPDIGLNRITEKIFKDIEKDILQKIEKENAFIDKAYYCFHHPYAKLEKYKKECNCRKPKTGLFLQAAKEMDIDLSKSWMIGDGLYDIVAGHNAGCKTILIANNVQTGHLKAIEEKLKNIKPDFIVKNLKEAILIFTNNS